LFKKPEEVLKTLQAFLIPNVGLKNVKSIQVIPFVKKIALFTKFAQNDRFDYICVKRPEL